MRRCTLLLALVAAASAQLVIESAERKVIVWHPASPLFHAVDHTVTLTASQIDGSGFAIPMQTDLKIRNDGRSAVASVVLCEPKELASRRAMIEVRGMGGKEWAAEDGAVRGADAAPPPAAARPPLPVVGRSCRPGRGTAGVASLPPACLGPESNPQVVDGSSKRLESTPAAPEGALLGASCEQWVLPSPLAQGKSATLEARPPPPAASLPVPGPSLACLKERLPAAAVAAPTPRGRSREAAGAGPRQRRAQPCRVEGGLAPPPPPPPPHPTHSPHLAGQGRVHRSADAQALGHPAGRAAARGVRGAFLPGGLPG